MNLNHIHLRVASAERAAAFYARYFGLAKHALHEDGVLFLRDGAGMDLALAPAQTIEPLPAWFHIGFRLESHAAVEALHARLREDGAAIRAPYVKEGDFSFFRCADLDGYLIEIYHEPD